MPQRATVTHKQEVFLLSYISLPTLAAACKAAGISDETGRRWLKLPEVQAAYKQMREDYLDQSLALLVSLTGAAIRTLARNLKEDAPPAVQVRAAQLLLEQSIEQHKMSELEQKIAMLEEIVKDRI